MVNLLVVRPVITRAQFISRIEQEIISLVELGDFTWDAHGA